MKWTLGVASYIVIWWIVIFAVLPFGIKPTEEGDIGHASGAPANPRLPLKMLITTVVAAVVWLILYGAIHFGLIDFTGS
jgi:predicted secreted protein